MTELFFSGFALSLSLCLDLGIVNVAAFSTAATRGAKPAFILGIGSCFGDLTYAVIAMLGVATLLHIAAVRWVLWLGGSAVLLYLAAKMLRQSFHASAVIARAETSGGISAGSKQEFAGDFGKGFAMAIASPSAILWFASVGGSLIATTAGGAGNNAWPFFLGFFICGVIWSVVVALVGSRIHASAERAGFAKAFTRGLAGLSALLFLALALKVMIDGYRTLL